MAQEPAPNIRGSNPTTASEGHLTQNFALKIVAGAQKNNAPWAPPAVNVYAFLFLHLPIHAASELQTARQSLSPGEIPYLEKAIAELENKEHQDDAHIATEYMAAASQNKLYDVHLTHLAVTNSGSFFIKEGATGAADLRSTPSEGKPILAVRCSESWMMSAGTNGARAKLVDQARIITRLREQPFWTVAVVLSRNQKEPLSLQLLSTNVDASPKGSPFIAVPTTLFNGGDGASDRVIEDLVIQALKVLERSNSSKTNE